MSEATRRLSLTLASQMALRIQYDEPESIVGVAKVFDIYLTDAHDVPKVLALPRRGRPPGKGKASG